VSVPFVGRGEELRALGALISEARRAGAPTAALINGEPGTGKSRLLREVLRETDPRRTVLVSGFEPIQSIPLGALADLLRRLVAVPDHGPRLDALAFGPSELRSQTPLPIFEATHRAASNVGHLIVAIDDLQWVDLESMALLHYLLRAAESTGQPLVVLATARPSAAATTFRDSVGAGLPEARRRVIQLGGLPKHDAVALVRAINEGLDDDAAVSLWRRAAGSPFWLEAIARNQGSTNEAVLVTEQLGGLSADAGNLINALAVGARPFGLQDLAGVAGWPAEHVDHAVRELVGRGLVIVERGLVRLSHDLIREAAAGVVPADTRRNFHERLASQLESTAGDDLHLLAEALDHRAAAGLPTADLAARLLRSPQRRLMSLDGLRRLSSIADGDPGSTGQLELDCEIGKLASILGEQALAMRHWLRAAATDIDPPRRQRALWEAALAASRLGQAVEAHANLDRAMSVAPADPEMTTRIEALRAEVALWLDHDTDAGAAAAGRAVAAGQAVARAAGGPAQLPPEARYAYLSALLAGIGAAMQQERFEDGRRLIDEALAVARGLDEESHVEALLRSGFALRALGSVYEAERLYRDAWNIAHRAVFPFAMIDAGIGLGRVLRDLGRLREARTVAAETLDLEARLGTPPGRWGNAVATLHGIQVALGDRSGLDALQADSRNHPNPHYRLSIHQQLATWQARIGGRRFVDDVERHLDAGMVDADLAGCPRCGAELAVVSAELLARLRRVGEAKRRLEAWNARPVVDYPRRAMWRTRAQAAILEAEGDAAGAATMIDALSETYEQYGLDDERLWALLDAGAIRAAFDREGAIDAYTRAASLANQIGAESRERIAARALRKLGVRAWRRGPDIASADGMGSLSTRELEVARLVAGGASNREIADALVVSPKTVERHVTNILAKVGARNRTQLASLVHSRSGGQPAA
jgi:DNA-binding CsgD family transcriptional regulator/tetratricopeptide (TPR) repeat protein